MALYKYAQFLQQSDHEAFDRLFVPGGLAPFSGIYRCEVCGREETSVKGHTLPAQNHHQHNPGIGQIMWRLVASH